MGIDQVAAAVKAKAAVPADTGILPAKASNPTARKLLSAYVAERAANPERSRLSSDQIRRETMRTIDNRLGLDVTQRERQQYVAERAPVVAQQGLERDFGQLERGNVADVKNWADVARTIINMKEAGDPEANQYANQVMWQYGDTIKQHVDVVDKDWWEKNYEAPPEPGTLDKILGVGVDALGAVGDVFNFLDQPGQRIMGAMGGVSAALDKNDEVSAADGLKHAGKQALAAFTDPLPDRVGAALGIDQSIERNKPFMISTSDGNLLSFDQDKDGHINLREAMGREAHEGGKLLDFLDFLGTEVLNPINYATFGAPGLAKAGGRAGIEGMEIIGRTVIKEAADTGFTQLSEVAAREAADRLTRTYGKKLWQQIQRQGLDSLNDVERLDWENAMQASLEMATRKGGRGGILTGFRRMDGTTLLESQKLAIEQGGRTGVRFAGRTLVPTERLIGPLRRAGVFKDDIYQVTRKIDDAASMGAHALADEVLDGLVELGPYGPNLDEVVRVSQRPNWRFAAPDSDPNWVFLSNTAGETVKLSIKDANEVLSLANDIEVAALIRGIARQEATAEAAQDAIDRFISRALPAARRETIEKLVFTEDVWEAGEAGVRSVPQARVATETTGVAGELGTGATRNTDALRETAARRKSYLPINRPAADEAGSLKNPLPLGPDAPPPTALEPFAGGLEAVPEPRRLGEIVEGAGRTPGTALEPYRGELVSTAAALGDDAATLIDDTIRLVDEAVPALPAGPFAGRAALGAGPAKGYIMDPKILAIAEANRDKVYLAMHRSGLGQKAAQLPGLKKLNIMFNTFSQTKMHFGREVADQFGELASNTRDSAEARNWIIRLGLDPKAGPGALDKAIKEFGDREAFYGLLDEAMGGGREAWDKAHAEAGPAVRAYLDTIQEWRVAMSDLALKNGANADELHNIDTWVPRAFTAKARRDGLLIDQLGMSTGGGGDSIVGDSFLQARTIAPEENTIAGANAWVKENLDLDTLDDIFSTNIPAAMAARTQAAFAQAAEIDLLHGLTRIDGFSGNSLALHLPKAKYSNPEAAAHGIIKSRGESVYDYVKVDDFENGDVFFLHRDIAKDAKDIGRLFRDQKAISEFGRLYDKMNNVWAGFATVLRPAFHARNEVGNLFLAFQAGVRSPEVFQRAAGLQRTATKIEKKMAAEGIDFARAADSLGIDSATQATLRNARDRGILAGGRGVDVLKSGVVDDFTGGGRYNPTSENFVLTAGARRRVAEPIENNARLAVFLDQMDKGATLDGAAAHTKKFLFDYGELTGTESGAIRRISRFYTFTRKNTALQFYYLTRYPGQASMLDKVSTGAVSGVMGSPDPEKPTEPPSWAGPAMLVTGSPWGVNNVGVEIDTPFTAFAETLDLLPALAELVKEKDPITGEGGPSAAITKLDTLFSGVGISVINVLDEWRTGLDSFTGRPLTPDTRFGDKLLFRAAAAFAPALAHYYGVAEKGGMAGRESAEREGWINIANLFAGFSVTPITDATEGAALSTLNYNLNELVRELEKQGVDVPTTEELRAQGVLAFKDRVAEALMYGWDPETEEWDPALRDERLLNVLPAEMIEAFGLDAEFDRKYGRDLGASGRSKGERPDVVEGSEEDIAAQQYDIKQMIRAMEVWYDRPLTAAEKVLMFQTLPGTPSNTDLATQGIEGYRDPSRNRFLPDEERKAEATTEERISRMAEALGLSVGDIRALSPRQSEADRIVAEGRAAGLTDEEILWKISRSEDEGGVGGTARNDRAFLNQLYNPGGDRMSGPFDITTTRSPQFTEEQFYKMQVKAWEAQNEIYMMAQLAGLPAPTAEMVDVYVNNAIGRTAASLEATGDVDLKGAKNREDIRSDADKAAVARRERDAARAGQSILPPVRTS